MSQYSMVTVYNNEGQQLGADHRSLMKFDFKKGQISYLTSCSFKPRIISICDPGFDDILVFLDELLDHVLPTKSTSQRTSYNVEEIEEWAHNEVWIDRNISWSITAKQRGGPFIGFFSANSDIVPAELDALEKMVRDFFNMEA